MGKIKTTFTKNDLESSTDIFDYLNPIIRQAFSRKSLVLNPIKKEVQNFSDKNANVLQTNIIGKQLLFNKATENSILEAIGIDSKELLNVFKSCEYFKQFGTLQLRDQLLFSIPLIMLSREFFLEGKIEESQFFYMTAFYKPYATIVFKYFGKYEVNEDQMRYTIENELSERYDIKREGTLFSVIAKKAESSFNNYVVESKRMTKLTDRQLHVIFTSGIYSRLNDFVQSMFREYDKNKGKYLSYELNSLELKDDSTSSESEGGSIDREIQSDAAVKNTIVKKAVSSINKKPIDERILDTAAKFGFVGTGATYGEYKYSGIYSDILRNTILEIVDKRFKDLPLLFESIIGSFLYEINPETGERYNVKDLKTAIFTNNVSKMFARSPNAKNENVLRVREMMENLLTECSTHYIDWGTTKKSALKKALHFYFVLLIQKG
jgi:hypothetical protein